MYSSAYLSTYAAELAAQPEPQYRPETAYQPQTQQQYGQPYEGYGSYDLPPYDSAPYDPQIAQYAQNPAYGPSGERGFDGSYAASSDVGYAYTDSYNSGATNDDDSDGSLRERLAKLPGSAVLGAICVVLLLACVTLLAMYVGQSGEASSKADDVRKAEVAVEQRDEKIKELDKSLAEAEQKIGSGTDQLSSSQNELLKLRTDVEKAKKDLDASTKDKDSLTSCLKALTAASAETDPVKRAQLAQSSQQTCKRGFELSGIKTT
ncbi:MAG: hypothetical protein ACRDTD_21640 [Pseudonocardiaceae bacterium]